MHVLSERLMRCNGYISGLKTDIAATKEERKKSRLVTYDRTRGD